MNKAPFLLTKDAGKKEALYLLTGASGNLGSSVARQLVAEDRDIRVLVLKGDPVTKHVLPLQVEILVGDVADRASLEHFFAASEGRDLVVIHCAGALTVLTEYNNGVYDANVIGTRNVVRKSIEHKVKKLVYVSSTVAIPELPKGQSIVEVDRYDPDAVVDFSARTMAWASQIVLDAVHERGLDASIVCPSGIVGPGEYGPLVSFIIDYVKGRIHSGTAGTFNFVDLRDLANGVISCCDRGRPGESYILANECISTRQLFNIVRASSGAKEINAILPTDVARVLAVLSSLVSRLSGKSARLGSFAVYDLARNNKYSSAKAERELGYRTRPFALTISDIISWLKSEGKI